MITYLRKWRILRMISNECKQVVSGEKKSVIDVDFIRKNTFYYGNLTDQQIEKIIIKKPIDAKTKLSLVLENISKKDGKKFIYRKILENAEKEGLIRFLDKKSMNLVSDEEYVGITGKGYEFSAIDSLIQEIFFKEYKGWITTAILLSSFLFKEKILEITSIVSPWR